MVEAGSEKKTVSIDVLRHLFYIGCRNFGVSQESCLALTLLLQSKEELGTMVRWMVKCEEKKEFPTSTDVILIAEKIKDYYMKHS